MITWLFTIALIVFITLPTLLVLFLYQRVITRSAAQHAWLAFTLLGAGLLSILFAIFAFRFRASNAGIVLILILPVLDGLLAVLLIHWQELIGYTQTHRKLAYASITAILVSLLVTLLGDEPSLALVVIVPPILIALLWNLSRRLDIAWTVVFALLLVVFLWADALGITAPHAIYADATLRSLYKIASGSAVLLVLVLAAIFIDTLYKPRSAEPPRPIRYLSLAALLVFSVGAATFRHGVLSRATGRAFEDHLPIVTLAVALIAGLVLALNLNPPARRAGVAFILLVPFSIYVFYLLGWQVNAQAVTLARLGNLEQAIQAYRQDTGAYPAALADLNSSYLPVLLGPLTGRGQSWCYQSGADYYRLGYVYFQRYYEYPDDTPFWEPYYSIEIPSSAGQPPPGEWICDDELRLFKTHDGL